MTGVKDHRELGNAIGPIAADDVATERAPCANAEAPPGDCCEACREQDRDSVVDLRDLMQGRRCLFIAHGERRYVLRITKQNRLILTKDESRPDAVALGGSTPDRSGRPS